ncbi:MAG: NAD(P)/FAD-dependent oxidoreductase [Bergeyella sp.]|nr:NAD(P)/FAD-dependent oxidoreductase [Bergeyella sp.]
MKPRVVIIGGGAAGFFCAANIDERLYDVFILEQAHEVLQKVKISGGGRCNVTHACFDPGVLVSYYPRGEKELLSVFSRFQPRDTVAWFEARGVKLKTEKDGRMFPLSDTSATITELLKKICEEKKFFVNTLSVVYRIEKATKGYIVHCAQKSYPADFIVFTTGSVPKSFNILESLGHSIVPLVPSLFTFCCDHPLLQDLSGTVFAHAIVNLESYKAKEEGALLITHWGFSGPAILKMSAREARLLAEKNYVFSVRINFLGLPKSHALDLLTHYKNSNPKTRLGSAKVFSVTHRFWERVLSFLNIEAHKMLGNISSKEMSRIIEGLCSMEFCISGKSPFKEEFVTAGGVLLKEINFRNMSSRVLPRFYFAGEVLDIDALTGGFNFQACWSEAWLIAQDLNLMKTG